MIRMGFAVDLSRVVVEAKECHGRVNHHGGGRFLQKRKAKKKVKQITKKGRFACRHATPSGNRTRVSPVAGAYSTTRPTVFGGCESSSHSMHIAELTGIINRRDGSRKKKSKIIFDLT